MNSNKPFNRSTNQAHEKINIFNQPHLIFTYFRTWFFIFLLVGGSYLYINPEVVNDVVNHFTKADKVKVQEGFKISKDTQELCRDLLNMTVTLSREKQSISYDTYKGKLEEIKEQKTLVSKDKLDPDLTRINSEMLKNVEEIGTYVILNYRDFSWSMEFYNDYSKHYDNVEKLVKQQQAKLATILDDNEIKYEIKSDGNIEYKY